MFPHGCADILYPLYVFLSRRNKYQSHITIPTTRYANVKQMLRSSSLFLEAVNNFNFRNSLHHVEKKEEFGALVPRLSHTFTLTAAMMRSFSIVLCKHMMTGHGGQILYSRKNLWHNSDTDVVIGRHCVCSAWVVWCSFLFSTIDPTEIILGCSIS